jgi:hypothetical protein
MQMAEQTKETHMVCKLIGFVYHERENNDSYNRGTIYVYSWNNSFRFDLINKLI